MFIKHCNSIKLKTLTFSFFYLSDPECGCDGWSLIAIMDHKLTLKLEARLGKQQSRNTEKAKPLMTFLIHHTSHGLPYLQASLM